MNRYEQYLKEGGDLGSAMIEKARQEEKQLKKEAGEKIFAYYKRKENLLRQQMEINKTQAVLDFKITFGKDGGNKLTWTVLDVVNGTALILMDLYALQHAFYKPKQGETDLSHVTWETSDLRRFLNGAFLNAFFSPAERAKIVPATLNTPDNHENYNMIDHPTPSFCQGRGGADTKDMIFVLSIEEYRKYCGHEIPIGWGDVTSWLRSPGKAPGYFAYVFAGKVYPGGSYCDNTRLAARPAMFVRV